jgi:hypothetical protein
MGEGALLSEKFASYVAHWRTLKGESRMPTLADFLDRAVPSFQPWISIFDVDGNSVRLRFFGTAIANFSGVDLTGRKLNDISVTEGHSVLLDLNYQVAQKCCGNVTSIRCTTSTRRDLELRIIGLPLARGDKVSVAWLNQPSVNLGMAETGIIIRGIVSQQWIDLGHGVPV